MPKTQIDEKLAEIEQKWKCQIYGKKYGGGQKKIPKILKMNGK